jgi:hypothetical protein
MNFFVMMEAANYGSDLNDDGDDDIDEGDSDE